MLMRIIERDGRHFYPSRERRVKKQTKRGRSYSRSSALDDVYYMFARFRASSMANPSVNIVRVSSPSRPSSTLIHRCSNLFSTLKEWSYFYFFTFDQKRHLYVTCYYQVVDWRVGGHLGLVKELKSMSNKWSVITFFVCPRSSVKRRKELYRWGYC